MIMELKRFVQFIMENQENLKTANNLNYISAKRPQEMYSKVTNALCILLTCPIAVVSDERRFSELKLINFTERQWCMADVFISLSSCQLKVSVLEHRNMMPNFADRKALSQTFLFILDALYCDNYHTCSRFHLTVFLLYSNIQITKLYCRIQATFHAINV